MQMLHGRTVNNGLAKLEIFHEEQSFSADEIFEHVAQKLYIQDQEDNYRSFKEIPLPRNTRYGRQVKSDQKKVPQVGYWECS